MEGQRFKAKYMLRLLRGDWNPFTPDVLIIYDQTIEHERRNWFLVSKDSQSYHFQNMIGVDIDKGLFGATVIIKSTGTGNIDVHGFSKRSADQIKALCSTQIIANSPRGSTQAMAEILGKAVSGNKETSVADEIRKLKSLVDEGMLSAEEFDAQKKKLLR